MRHYKYDWFYSDNNQGSVHGKQGWAVLVFSLALTSVDVYSIFRRIIAYFRGGVKFTIASFWSSAVLGRDVLSTSLLSEYTGLVTDEPDEFQESKNINIRRGLHDPHHDEDAPHFSTAQWASNVHRHRREYSHSTLCNRSVHSDDDTLHDLDYIVPNPKPPLAKRIPRAAFATCERALVLAGLAQFLTGIVIYTGGCRENYINGCLAHLISVSSFFSLLAVNNMQRAPYSGATAFSHSHAFWGLFQSMDGLGIGHHQAIVFRQSLLNLSSSFSTESPTHGWSGSAPIQVTPTLRNKFST